MTNKEAFADHSLTAPDAPEKGWTATPDNSPGAAMTHTTHYQSIVDKNAIKDLIEEAITDSFGPDWTPSDAAYHVMQWLEDEGLMFVKKPERGTECPNAPDGRCQVDTSMESGPNNCFHCERPM